MLWSHKKPLGIVVHSHSAPGDDEWDAYLADLPAANVLDAYRFIIFSLGGGPSGAQRGRLVHLLQGRTPRAALLTSSTLMRGIGTAVSWFIPSLKLFPLDERRGAFRHLDLAPDEAREANATIDRLLHELGAHAQGATTNK